MKENMEYVYRIICVGGRAATEVYRFSTDKNYKTSFGVAALSNRTGRREALDRLQSRGEDVSFFALLGGGRLDENGRTLFSELPLWSRKPGIYIGTDRSEAGSVLDAGANLFFGRTEEGGLLVSGEKGGEVLTYEADYAEVVGYENRLELECFGREDLVTARLMLK